MEQKNIFGGIFGRSAEISAAQSQIKFQKLGKWRVKIQKICIFLVKCDSKCHIMPQKKKKLSRVFSPYKASKSISNLIIVSNDEK